MNYPEIITTPTGEENVVLPRKDYDALVAALVEAEEELADIATLDRRKAEMSSEMASRLSPEVSTYLLKGFTRLAAVRQWRGVSTAELGRLAHIDEATLVDLETGNRPATHEQAEHLAKALDVPTAWLEP